MAQLSVLRGYTRDEIGELVAGRWTDGQLNSWLNRGVKYLINVFHDNACWDLLYKTTRKITTALTSAVDEYAVYNIINKKTTWSTTGANRPSLVNDYYGFVKAMRGNYRCEKATAEEYNRIITSGEYRASITNPYILFYGYDGTKNVVSFSQGGVGAGYEPKVGDVVTGNADDDYATLYHIRLDTGTWADGDAAGYFYIGDITAGVTGDGHFDIGDQLDCYENSNIATVANTIELTEDHGGLPFFITKPTPTSAETFMFWYLVHPTTMSAATDEPSLSPLCDDLLVLYAAARAWKADGSLDRYAALKGELNEEIQTLIKKYSEPVWYPLRNMPVM